jgi:hypothetical protein
MSFADELQRYLSRGIDLQHRRLEWIRRLKNGDPYQNQMEERVKWRQDVRYNVRPDAPVRPAIWDILPVYF